MSGRQVLGPWGRVFWEMWALLPVPLVLATPGLAAAQAAAPPPASRKAEAGRELTQERPRRGAMCTGKVFSPRVLSPHTADAYSMKTFAQFPRWRDLRGDALAYEVYKYLADTRTGLFHMNVVSEGLDDVGEFTQVRDPVKIINAYGYAYCGILGPVMAGICEEMGIGASRTLTLPAWKHVAAETFYGGRWHYLDVDVRAVFRRPDGTLASMAEAQQDASLWRDRGPLFFPNDPLESTREIYRRTPVEYYHGFHQSGHTMDYVLRPGETFTRWWEPQGGRWQHLPSYNDQEWLRRLLESEPRGPKPNHRHFTIHNHGNGRFVYAPDLTHRSSDFAEGVYARQNVQVAESGLTLEEAGEGFAVFEVRSPYPIVPRVGEMATAADDREASVAEIDAAGASLAVSLDNGLTWQEVSAHGWPAAVDLTRFVSGRYGYLLRIGLRGQPREAVVRSLKITTWVQVAPASLPWLGKGKNRLELVTGDHYGGNTRILEVRSYASRPEELLKYLVEPPRDYDPQRRTSKIVGPITVRIAAPPGTRIAWFTASGQFRTHFHEAARRNRNSIAYAVDRPEQFQEIYRADVPTYVDHWHYNASREVRLASPAKAIYVRYVGDPAMNNFAVYAHCLEDRRGHSSPVRVRHTWNEDGVRKVQSLLLQRPGPYEIETRAEPTNESIEIAVPRSAAD